MKILIMGLPDSGKTTLARELVHLLKAKWLNADEIRKEYNDWDFSEEGRKRQAKRMLDLSNKFLEEGNIVIADFVCPTPKTRELFDADFLIWMDTIKKSKFEDTNIMFIPPKNFDFRIKEKNAKVWSLKIFDKILKIKDQKKL